MADFSSADLETKHDALARQFAGLESRLESRLSYCEHQSDPGNPSSSSAPARVAEVEEQLVELEQRLAIAEGSAQGFASDVDALRAELWAGLEVAIVAERRLPPQRGDELNLSSDEDEDAESAVAEAAARVRDDLLQSVEDRVVDVEDRVLRELQVRGAPAVCTACALAADHFRA